MRIDRAMSLPSPDGFSSGETESIHALASVATALRLWLAVEGPKTIPEVPFGSRGFRGV